jgi:broad specificity phosphatase PhoE
MSAACESHPVQLILIKHAAPEIRGADPAARWSLSEAGRRSCADLAAHLHGLGVRHLVSSAEPKAVETAQQAARRLDIDASIGAGLGEHRRDSVGLFADAADFRDAVRRMLAAPGERVFGDETAAEARDRFEEAVAAVVGGWSHPGPAAIVAHGTVISLLVERWTGRDAFDTWSRLGLPSFVRLDAASRALLEIAGDLSPPVDDAALLDFYAARGAEPWNTSAACAGIEHRLRGWLEGRDIAPADVCNLGIGEGSWDDYLGHRFAVAAITSIDIDAGICDLLRARQRREGHPNPSTALCLDLLDATPVDRFDLVTAVGSTLDETGDAGAAITSAVVALRPGGWLYLAAFAPLADPAGAEVIDRLEDRELGVFALWARRR